MAWSTIYFLKSAINNHCRHMFMKNMMTRYDIGRPTSINLCKNKAGALRNAIGFR